MKILVYGGLGRMGKCVCKEAEKLGYKAIIVDKDKKATPDDLRGLDGIIDFSAPSSVDELLKIATENNLPLVIATTGHTKSQIAKIKKAGKSISICLTANTSKGIGVLNKICTYIYNEYDTCEAEIVEYHHKNKVDSPSGTAKLIAENLKALRKGKVKCGRSGKGVRALNEIGISSVRGGSEIGTHQVIFYCDNEIITVKHQALDRNLFALGAILTLEKLKDKKKGFYKEV